MKAKESSKRWERTLKASLRFQERCIALDMDGHQCRKIAARVTCYHGDGEIYDHQNPEPSWVRAAFCEQHSRGSNG